MTKNLNKFKLIINTQMDQSAYKAQQTEGLDRTDGSATIKCIQTGDDR